MLRRLGLVHQNGVTAGSDGPPDVPGSAAVNGDANDTEEGQTGTTGAPETSTTEPEAPTAVFAPRVDYDLPTRYFKVVYRGAVAVRANPTEPAAEDGQSFSFGDVIEACGLAVAVPEGVLVEVKQPQGGWVFQRHGDQTLLEEVEALKVEEGDWWYRVVHPAGAYFVKIPSLLPKAPRHTAPVPQNSVVHACRRHTPPGSSVSFVELSDKKGWILESAADGSVLEKAADGKFIVEHITGEYRDDSEAWYRVASEDGVELLEGPDTQGRTLREAFLPDKAFCASQRFQPPGQASVYLKVKGREAWLLQSAGVPDGGDTCEKLPPPMDEAIEQWYRVDYPGGVRLRNSPSFEHTDPSLGVLVCGWVFLATRRYRAPGSSHMFLQVATPEGVVRDTRDEEADANGDSEDPLAAQRRAANRHCGWVPYDSNGEQVVTETLEPWIERGLFAYQVVVDKTLSATSGPRHNAPAVLQHLPPYSVAAVATFLETGDGAEGYVQFAGTGAWVLARRNSDTRMVRLAGFPAVDRTPRRFVVAASEGVETIVGPSSMAQPTGRIIPAATEGRSEMVWTVGGWPGDRGTGDKKFVLLEELGWVPLDVGSEEPPLEELDSEAEAATAAVADAPAQDGP